MIVRCCVLATLFAAAYVGRAVLDHPHVVTTAESLVGFPAVLDEWHGQDLPLEPEVVQTAAVDDYVNRYYRSGDGELGLYVGYYQSQREGEALHSPLFCLPGAGWQPIVSDRIDLRLTGSAPQSVNKLVVERGIDRLLVLYWYQTVSRVTASEYWRKLFLMHDAFVSGRTDVALVRIIAPIDARFHANESQALSLARPFAERVLPEVQRRLFRE